MVSKSAAQRSDPGQFVGQDILERLRWDILDGVVAPDAKLPFAMLQSRYGAGVGTIREALSYLASEGLVRVDAGRGFRVAPISKVDFLDITAMRIDLEKRALEDAIKHGDDAWEVRIISTFHLLDKMESRPLEERLKEASSWTKMHRDFHEALVSACRSRWLLHFRALLFDQADRYRLLSQRHRPATTDRRGEHRAIMDLTLSRDAHGACRMAKQHIKRTEDDVVRYVPQLAPSKHSR